MSEGGKRWGWGVDFEERDGSLLLLPQWGGWKEVTLAVPERGCCLFDEKQLIVSETRPGCFSNQSFLFYFSFLWKGRREEEKEEGGREGERKSS